MGAWTFATVLAVVFTVVQPVGAAGALAWTAGAGFRSVALPAPPTEVRVGFTAMDPAVTGVGFTNELRGDLALTNAVAHNGAGVAIGDIDGNDLPDLYFCNLQGPNRLYQNGGNWRFTAMAAGPAACAEQLSTGAAFADVDGDGDLDLLVNGIAVGTRLFRNDGQGGWTEVEDSGLSRTASATSMALADIDGDGDLDLYCAHYIDVMHLADPTTRFALARREGRWEVTKVNGEPTTLPRWQGRFEALADGRVRELPEYHGLYRNDGTGRFKAIEFEPGVFRGVDGTPVGPFRDWGLSVMFRDLNRDGAPDFYVCNDNASPDRFWINAGDGTFRAADAGWLRHTSRSSMALDFADLDRDGYDDLLVLDMFARHHGRRMRQLMRDYPDPAASERPEEQPRFNRNTLFFGQPDGSYVEAAFLAGLAATDWSWCPIFLDVDLDGFEDLLVSNGFEFDVMDVDSHDRLRTAKLTFEQRRRFRQFHPSWFTENAAFRNQRDRTFVLVSREWGFHKAGVSCGMAVGDLDGDGDLDVVVNNVNDAASLYRNDATAGRLAVRLQGRPPNTQGIGARLTVEGGPVSQTQEIISGGRYMSGDQALRVFAVAPDSARPLRLEVRWRNGDRTALEVAPNQICEVIQPEPHGTPVAPAPVPRPEPWFRDVSDRLGHVHVEEDFDDWARQPLLPRRLSRLGPGVGWYDVNGDGWEDAIVSAGRGGKLAVFVNQQGERFQRVEAVEAAADDQGAVLGWADGKGKRQLLVAVSNYESGNESGNGLLSYALTNLAAGSLRVTRTLTMSQASPGPLATADVDGDGDLDLFVGGRFQPGRYPEPVSSSLWLNEGGELRLSAEGSKPFEALGLVSGATFCDLDGDGDPDLALAVEWGPVRVFRNDRGRFDDMTAAWGLGSRPGWWTSVTAGDFDGDGRLDLAAGNWGQNSMYALDRPPAWRVFYGDWNTDGNLEVIEAWQQAGQWYPVRSRMWLARGFPELPQRFSTHEAYGKATVQELLPGRPEQARILEATQLESAVFLNRGSNFLWRPLPQTAQLSPVFGVSTGDFDSDGSDDLFLSQNFFGSGSDLSRDDGGRGLWLRGKGDGQFEAMETGIRIDGEQRAAALADYNHDGRVDVLVAQNHGATQLYANVRARRGLRVKLVGLPANPDAIGAQLRVRYADGRMGPGRALQAGSGYWAHESTVVLLGLAEPAVGLWIRWPGGREQSVPVGENQMELTVKCDHEPAS